MSDREPIDITIGDLIAAVTEAVAPLTRNKGETNHLVSYILRDLFARCRVRFKNGDAVSRRQPIRYRSAPKTNLAMKWLVKPSGEVVAVNKDAGALNEMKARLGNDEMKITAFAADRTVTVCRFDLSGRLDRETDSAAVAAARMFHPVTWHGFTRQTSRTISA